MSKLFGLNKPNTNLRKNVFDLSEKNLYSSSVGLLIPLLCRELNPGEKVQVSVNALTRSMPLNTAAFVRSRQYFHYFFVPFRQLWSGWDNFINSVDYKTSSFQKDAIYSRIPGIDLFKSIADLLEDGYLTPAFNLATKQLEVPEGVTIREYTTSYKNVNKLAKEANKNETFDKGYHIRGDGNLVADSRINAILKRLGSGRQLSADDQKYYDDWLKKKEEVNKTNKPATPTVSKNIWELFPGDNSSASPVYYITSTYNGRGLHDDIAPLLPDNSKILEFLDYSKPVYIYHYGVRKIMPKFLTKSSDGHFYVYDWNEDNLNFTGRISLAEYVGRSDNNYINFVGGIDYVEPSSNNREVLSNDESGFPEWSISDAYLAKLLGIAYIPVNRTAGEITTAYSAFKNGASTSTTDVNNSAVPASQGKPIEFAPDKVNKTLDEQGYSLITGISRLLDMLEYGFTYVEYDDETQSYTQKASTLVDLLDSLNSKKINVLQWLRSEKNKCVVNPFRLLAYQKIYSDFYKRDDYEATNPLYWNIDDFKRGSAVMDFDDNKRLLNMLRIRYRWHNKDYFTGVVPSELLGGLQGFNANSLGMFGDDMQINSDDNKVSVGSGNVSTKGIRAMFALEKLMRLTRRAGGFDYISQTLAHYGFEPPRGRGDKVEFVGGTATNINISEVLSTADTSKGFTGQIYGRGIGSIDEKGNTEFTAKEHGILMCVASIVPDSDYSAEGLNSFNAKLQRGDYFQPEFQDLGLQPVFNYELYNRIYSDNMPQNLRINKGVLGFSPRYAEYKSAYDKLHGEFRNGRDLSAWSSVSNVTDTNQGVARNSLKINPGVFNRIFASEYNGHESTDQFLTSAQFECKIIRPMSVTGQNL